jgi:hypothetical protein
MQMYFNMGVPHADQRRKCLISLIPMGAGIRTYSQTRPGTTVTGLAELLDMHHPLGRCAQIVST